MKHRIDRKPSWGSSWDEWSLFKKVLLASIALRVVLIFFFAFADFAAASAAPGHYEISRMTGMVGGLVVELIIFSCIR